MRPGPGAPRRRPRRRSRRRHADPHAEAVALLRRALAGGDPDAPGLLAAAHLARGQRRAAREILAHAVHRRGHDELAGLLGETLAELGDHGGAERAFLLGLDAADAGAMNGYGVFLRDRGRTQEAAYVLDRAARAGDELAPLNLVTLHLEELDDPRTATALAEQYAADDRPSALVALADVRLAAGRVADAEQLYRRAAELGGPRAHVYYAWFLQDRRGDQEGAERELRAGHAAHEAGATLQLGRFLFDAGRTEEAHPLFLEAAHRGDVEAREALEEYDGTVDRWDD